MIHIKISDSGWILEKLASEISSRLPYVTYDTSPNANAAIQYYMTYGCRLERVSPIEIALFTHKEQVPSAAEKFERVAAQVDFCVAQSPATAAILNAQKIADVTTICPGVDLNRFSPKLKIGVVGRTYHTGRKGEALIASVMDIPGIEWHFTGPGWPGPAEFVPEEDMPAFYRSLDYVLVPALIEGGPMCVLEALASGCEVIGAPVGWVPLFPHIPFKLGDAEDLRRVLLRLIEKKVDLRKNVEAYTWNAWAEKHHQLFVRLLGHDPLEQANANASLRYASTEDGKQLKAAILVHGEEMTGSRGGPSVRAPRTAAALRRIGVAADFLPSRNFDAREYDVCHAFNVWAPKTCDVLMKQIEKANVPLAFSPIFLNLIEFPTFQQKLPEILSHSTTVTQAIDELAKVREELSRVRAARMSEVEPLPGYFSKVREMTSRADHLILLSKHEGKLLESIEARHTSTSIVKNPVDVAVFGNGDPTLFQQAFGVTDYVLCVGRIESRKNQALLALALREVDLPLVLIGHEGDSRYGQLVRKWGNSNLILTGRIEPGSPMLASALAGARVFCLPSWSEGAPLAALEAAAAGCNMVLSNRSSEEEYFGDLARYIDPADPLDIRDKILAAYSDPTWDERRESLVQLIKAEHSWERYAKDTADAYVLARARHAEKDTERKISRYLGEIFVDVTTLGHHKGAPTGIARVEDRIISELMRNRSVRCRFILWNSHYKRFIEVEKDQISSGEIKQLSESSLPNILKNPLENAPGADIDFSPGAPLIILGSAWMRNENYLNDLWILKTANRLALTAAIYDVIQFKYPYLYPKDTSSTFISNCTRLLRISDIVLTCSEASRRDIVDMCIAQNIPVPPLNVFRLGDEAASIDPSAVVQKDVIDQLNQGNFILYVSSIDARKNHAMLFNLWQRLLKEFGNSIPTLVLVGRVGWKAEEVLQVLETNPILREHVIILHGINDLSLEWLYNNCLYTIYPSLYEGWGLPVAESLRHGKFCIASNGGSLPEVGPGFVEYIDPLDFVGWYKSIKHHIFNSNLLREKVARIENYTTTDWIDVTREVMNFATAAEGNCHLPILSTGEALSFVDSLGDGGINTKSYLFGGWGRIENTGTWSVGTLSTLAFRLDRPADGQLALQLQAFGYAAETEPVQVIVLLNGTTVGRWTISASPLKYCAIIPDRLINHESDVRLEFKILNPRAPSRSGNSGDGRLLGFKAQAILFDSVTAIAPGQWQILNDGSASDLILQRATKVEDTKFLGFVIESDEPTTARIAINGKSACVLAVGASQEAIGALELATLIPEDQETFSLSFTLDKPDARGRIVRLGTFENWPVEVIRKALALTSTAKHGDRHAPYTGGAPKLGPGIAASPSELFGGLVGGWHATEPYGAWTNGRPASIYVQPEMRITSRGARIRVHCTPFGPVRDSGAIFEIKVGAQPYQLLINDQQSSVSNNDFLSEFNFGPEDLDEDGNLAVTFRSSGSIAPSALLNSSDGRLLALMLHSITIIEPVPVQDIGLELPMPKEEKLGGWWNSEPDGRWSDGTASSLTIPLPQGQGQALLYLEILAFYGIVNGKPANVMIDADGVQTCFEVGSTSTICEVPIQYHANQGRIKVTLTSDRAARPSELNDSVDQRLLSFKLISCSIKEHGAEHSIAFALEENIFGSEQVTDIL